MNKSLKILLALVVAAAVAYYVVDRQGWTTLKRELRDFSIKDTGTVTKIFFADRKGGRVLLEKNAEGIWILDGKYKADMDKVNLVLATMHDIQVRNPVPEKEFNQVVAFLASEGTKAEFYAGEKHLKTIYVGPSTPDQTGTFMLIDGSSTPFVTHIPGFVGYLTPRFLTEQIKWRSKEVFNADPKEIRSVSVEYPSTPVESFTVNNGMQPELISMSTNSKADADPKHLRYYLGCFRDLYFEGFEESLTGPRADSVRNTPPYCIITLKNAKDELTRLVIHQKAIDRRTKQQSDEKGNKLPYDTEKYFAFLNDQKEVLLIQDFTFNKVIRRLSDFTGQ